MKDYIIATMICLALTCWVNDIGAQPKSYPIQIPDTEQRPLPVQHQDGLIPEMNMTETSRPAGIITSIKDSKGCRECLYFPLGANN